MSKYFTIFFFVWSTYLTTYAQQTTADKLNQHMLAQANAKDFNGNVLVAKNGQILYQKAVG